MTVTSSMATELYGRRLVLVRPDGHVAWRGDEMPPNPGEVIDRVRGVAASGGYATARASTTAKPAA